MCQPRLINCNKCTILVVVQLISHVQLFMTPWTAAHQTSLSFATSKSLLKLMSIELVMSSNHLILSRPLLFLPSLQASGYFLMSQLFASSGPSTGASASVLPMNIQDWLPLELTGLVCLQSKGLSRVFSNTTVQKHDSQAETISFAYNFLVLLLTLFCAKCNCHHPSSLHLNIASSSSLCWNPTLGERQW